MGNHIRLRLEGKEAAAALVLSKSGDAALLYAYCLTQAGPADLGAAAQVLELAPDRILQAAQTLRLHGLAEDAARPPRVRAEYQTSELIAAKQDPSFSGLCVFLETALGRPLKKSHYEALFCMYDTLDMDPNAIMLLINDCKQRGALTARELMKVAYRWSDAGVTTYEQAVERLETDGRLHSRTAQVLRSFGLEGRAPVQSEIDYVRRWDEWGMSDDLIRMAYERTVLRTGKLQWGYLNKILESWHEKGCRTPKQVEQLDAAPQKSFRPVNAPAEKTEKQEIVAAVTRQFEEKRRLRETRLAQRLEELRSRSPAFVRFETERRKAASAAALAAMTGDQNRLQELQQRSQLLAEKQKQLLAELDLPADWLEDKPDCPDCKDTGFIGSTMCHCFREACRREQQERRLRK